MEKWPRPPRQGDRVQHRVTMKFGTIIENQKVSQPTGVRFDGDSKDEYMGNGILRFLGD